MTERNDSSLPTRLEREDEEVNLLQLAAVPLRRWRLVAASVIGTILIGFVLELALLDDYTTKTVIVPSRRERGLVGPWGALESELPLPLDLSREPDEKLIYTIATSRSIRDSIMARLGIPPDADDPRADEVRQLLEKRVDIRVASEGSFEIGVTGRDPALITRIANLFPVLINHLSAGLKSQEAQRRREFLQAQIQRVEEDLRSSEDRLVEFQRGSDLLQVEEQVGQTIEAASTLQQRIIEKEVEVQMLRRIATSQNPELQAALAELGMLRGQLNRLTRGGSGGDVFLSFPEAPNLGTMYAGLLREYKRNEEILGTLTAALAEAQIEASNDLPIVSVLDVARHPRFPAGFSLPFSLALAAILGFGIGIGGVFVVDWFTALRRNPSNHGFFEAWHGFRSDVERTIRRRS